LTVDGYIACDIFHGSFNTERFNEFIHLRVLPLCQPGYSVLVLDNCGIHQSGELKDICREADVELAFLPPYSPNLNLIEQSFHVLKQWMQRHQDLAKSEAYQDNPERFIWFAVDSFMEGKDIKGYFQDTHIYID
jgi:transposase